MNGARLAAVVYGRNDAVDPLLAAFSADLRARGVRVGGLVQVDADAGACAARDMSLVDLETSERIPICQDLGPDARGCRVDPRALAEAGAHLRRALAGAPDLLVVNKFGKLEAEGGGLLAEIAGAVAEGTPVMVGVPMRFVEAWDAFAGGLDLKLACRRADLEAWFAGLAGPEARP